MLVLPSLPSPNTDMPSNPEDVSRYLRNKPPQPFRYTEEYQQSQWAKIIDELEQASITAAMIKIMSETDAPPKKNVPRPPYVAHFHDFLTWMNYEGYTYSWQDVWQEWRAIGAFYQTIPPVDETVVPGVIDLFNRRFHIRQANEDTFTLVAPRIRYAVERTFFDYIDREGKLFPDTLATIHWMDWMIKEGHQYTKSDTDNIWRDLCVEFYIPKKD